MKVILLAAGVGKRFKPLKTDKLLLPLMGKSVFYHILSTLRDHLSSDELILVANSNNKSDLSKVAEELGLKAQITIQDQPGMGQAVLSAQDLIEGDVLVLNGDDFLGSEVYQTVKDKASSSSADIVFAAKKVKQYFPGGYLKLEADKVVGIIEKPGQGNEPNDLIKLVVDYFKDGPKLVEAIKSAQTDKDDQYEVALDNLISSGLKVEAAVYEGFWQGIKYPWHVLNATAYLLESLKRDIHSSAQIAGNAVVDGEVVIEEGVKIFEGAIIKGPCYIGKNTVIASNTLVRESIIENDCVIGGYTEVARSYIGPHSWFHKNYIGDSIIEGEFEMGSGAITANLRLDGKDIKVGEERIQTNRNKLGMIAGKGVRIGCNSVVQPGVRIGANSLIGSGVVVSRDVEENTKIVLKQEYEVSEFLGDNTDYSEFKGKLK